MITTRATFSLTLMFFTISSSLAQTYRVDLSRISTVDDAGTHMEVFSPSPKHPLVLPAIDTTGARFFEEFYSWNVKANPEIAVMVIPARDGEYLYIDRNNNRDLTDDGPPSFFPYAQNDFYFDISPPLESSLQEIASSRSSGVQHTRFLLHRWPTAPDSEKSHWADSSGNLLPRFAAVWAGLTGRLDFEGKRGTFYADDRLAVRRGTLIIHSKKYEIGLYDWDNDGLFDGKADMLLVDFNRDGRLERYRESVGLDDVFVLDSLHFTIDQVDPYGKWVQLTVTSKPVTHHLQARFDSLARRSDVQGFVDDVMWGIKAQTLNGDTIALKQYRGQRLLLNFWAEDCEPCNTEIPVLLQAKAKHGKSDLIILSFVRSCDTLQARKTFRDQGMTWPQLLLTDSLQKRIGIHGYPTNILILPSGQYYLQAGAMQPSFLDGRMQ